MGETLILVGLAVLLLIYAPPGDMQALDMSPWLAIALIVIGAALRAVAIIRGKDDA